ncbi:MAG: hypothetical protein RR303_01230 [Bacteroidales bacterium]
MNKQVALIIVLLASVSLMRAENSAANKKKNPGFQIVHTDKKTGQLFQATRPASSNSGEVAQYTLKEKEERFMMQLVGYIKPIMGWDIGNVLDGINFIPGDIPVPATKGNKADYFANPMHSAIGVHILALPKTKHQVTGYIQGMFNGPKSAFQIHHVYIGYRGFLLGRTTTLFCDDHSKLTTIDPQGPNGAVDTHSYQVSYTKEFKCGIQLGVSLELPTFDKYPGEYYGKDYPQLDGTLYYGDASQPIPDIPLYIQYQGKGMNRIRLSGIMRNFFYRDQKEDATHHLSGWGVQLSGNIQPVNPLVFYYQCTYGKGIANYIQDLNGRPLSYIPENTRPGKMIATPMMGWLAGASYRFTNKLTMGAVYSQARIWDSGTYYPEYRQGQYIAANLFYSIRKYLTFGVEYLWGDHQEYGDKSARLNRIQTMMKLSF